MLQWQAGCGGCVEGRRAGVRGCRRGRRSSARVRWVRCRAGGTAGDRPRAAEAAAARAACEDLGTCCCQNALARSCRGNSFACVCACACVCTWPLCTGRRRPPGAGPAQQRRRLLPRRPVCVWNRGGGKGRGHLFSAGPVHSPAAPPRCVSLPDGTALTSAALGVRSSQPPRPLSLPQRDARLGPRTPPPPSRALSASSCSARRRRC